jgi:hypothetical protein
MVFDQGEPLRDSVKQVTLLQPTSETAPAALMAKVLT